MLLVVIWRDEKCLPMIRTIWKKCFWIDSTNTVNLNRNGDEASKNFVLNTYKCVKRSPNTEFFWSVLSCIRTKYSVNLRIQSEYTKAQIRKNSTLDTFHAVVVFQYLILRTISAELFLLINSVMVILLKIFLQVSKGKSTYYYSSKFTIKSKVCVQMYQFKNPQVSVQTFSPSKSNHTLRT